MVKCVPCENLTPRGEFRHKVVLKYQTATPTILNESGTESSGTAVQAAIKTLSGSDRHYANQRNPQVNKKVCIDYRSDVTPDWWIEHVKHGATKTYQIEWIDNVDERDRELQIYVTERV